MRGRSSRAWPRARLWLRAEPSSSMPRRGSPPERRALTSGPPPHPRARGAERMNSGFIEGLMELALRNRLQVIVLASLLAVAGAYSLVTASVDAIPDLSENSVIVFA